MIDIRKAMRLLDVMYVTANEGIRQSVEKITTLAQLDPPPFGAAPGPFETMLNEFEPIKWNWSYVKDSADKFERFLSSPHNEWQFTNWLTTYVNNIPSITSMSIRIDKLEQQLNLLQAMITNLQHNKDNNESELNSNTK